jgi:hypothetical protein
MHTPKRVLATEQATPLLTINDLAKDMLFEILVKNCFGCRHGSGSCGKLRVARCRAKVWSQVCKSWRAVLSQYKLLKRYSSPACLPRYFIEYDNVSGVLPLLNSSFVQQHSLFETAARYNAVHVADALVEHGVQISNPGYLLSSAASSGNIDFMNWIATHYHMSDSHHPEWLDPFLGQILEIVLKRGRDQCLSWFATYAIRDCIIVHIDKMLHPSRLYYRSFQCSTVENLIDLVNFPLQFRHHTALAYIGSLKLVQRAVQTPDPSSYKPPCQMHMSYASAYSVHREIVIWLIENGCLSGVDFDFALEVLDNDDVAALEKLANAQCKAIVTIFAALSLNSQIKLSTIKCALSLGVLTLPYDTWTPLTSKLMLVARPDIFTFLEEHYGAKVNPSSDEISADFLDCHRYWDADRPCDASESKRRRMGCFLALKLKGKLCPVHDKVVEE